ncbi:hypothetical protein V496_05845 [Pseudogymnoascus sp. VKM F-4515 (FW-2607)]|nr:hypothetical protein V496_05845 [Pseudogymnoascus sp. VKM F-4515 (FW-2607)]
MATYDESNKRHDGTEHTGADGALAGAAGDERRLGWLRESTGSGSGSGTGAASGEANGDGGHWDGASRGGDDGESGGLGGLDGGWAGDDDDVAVGGGEDDLGNGDLGGDGGDGEGGLGGGASWLAWDGDGGLDDDGGHWDGVGLLGGGLNSLGWAVGDDTGVGWDVWRADTLEELAGGVDLLLGSTEGGQALKELLGEVGLGAEAGNVGVGLALNWEPGLDALGEDWWAGKAGVAAWGGVVGGLGRSDGGVGWLWAGLGGRWDVSWLGTLSSSWLSGGLGLSWNLAGLLWARRLGAGALGAEGLGGGEDDSRGGQGGLDRGEARGDVGEGNWARGDGDIGDDGGQGDLGLGGSWGLLLVGGHGAGSGLWNRWGGLRLSRGGLWDRWGGLWNRWGGLWDRWGGLWNRWGGLWLSRGGLWDRWGSLWNRWGGLWNRWGSLWNRWGGLWDRWGGLWLSRGGLDRRGSGGGRDGASSSSAGWAVEADAVDANVALGLSSLRWLGVDDGDVGGSTALGVLDGGTGLLAVRLLLAHLVAGEGVVELELAVELDGDLEVGDGELVDRLGLDLGAVLLVATYAEGPWEESVTLAAAEGRLAAPSAGEVKASVVVEGSEVQVTPVESTVLVRLALVDGGLAGAREDRSVVPSL